MNNHIQLTFPLNSGYAAPNLQNPTTLDETRQAASERSQCQEINDTLDHARGLQENVKYFDGKSRDLNPADNMVAIAGERWDDYSRYDAVAKFSGEPKGRLLPQTNSLQAEVRDGVYTTSTSYEHSGDTERIVVTQNANTDKVDHDRKELFYDSAKGTITYIHDWE